MTFKMYDKISKLERKDTDGIFDGTVYIQPKLDGTNGSIWWEDGSVKCGSRKRVLTVDDDNAGFCKYVKEHEGIQNLLSAYPTYHLYGEWMVPHTFKKYKEEIWRHLYIFDVYDVERGRLLEPPKYYDILRTYGLDVMPYYIRKDIGKDKLVTLRKNFSNFLTIDSVEGEGIVLKNYGFINAFGRCTFAKYLNEELTLSRKKRGKKRSPVDGEIEVQLAKRLVSIHLIHKVHAKLDLEIGGYTQQMIPRLLETVWYDCINEELYDELKKMRLPTINFRLLKAEVYDKIKESTPELF